MKLMAMMMMMIKLILNISFYKFYIIYTTLIIRINIKYIHLSVPCENIIDN